MGPTWKTQFITNVEYRVIIENRSEDNNIVKATFNIFLPQTDIGHHLTFRIVSPAIDGHVEWMIDGSA